MKGLIKKISAIFIIITMMMAFLLIENIEAATTYYQDPLAEYVVIKGSSYLQGATEISVDITVKSTGLSQPMTGFVIPVGGSGAAPQVIYNGMYTWIDDDTKPTVTCRTTGWSVTEVSDSNSHSIDGYRVDGYYSITVEKDDLSDTISQTSSVTIQVTFKTESVQLTR